MKKTLALALAATTALSTGALAQEITEFRIGILGGENAQDRMNSYQCLADYTTEALGVETKLFAPADYNGVIQGLLGGTIDMAWLGASSYAATYLQDPEAVEPVLGKVNIDGSIGYHSIGFAGLDAPADLVRDALFETRSPIRRDIAPRNATVRATFITEPLDPVVRADPRFQQALDLSSKDPFASCAMWTGMAEEYSDAPAVIHYLGACAEATSDFQAAQGHYAKAAELSVAFSADGVTAGGDFLKSLRDLSNQRADLEILEELTAPWMPVETETESASGS